MSCPPSAPILCENTTVSRGLCVTKKSRCAKRRTNKKPRALPKPPLNEKGKKYAYIDDFLGHHCYFTDSDIKVDYDQSYPDGEEVPDTFSCLTYNIWGLAKKETLKHLFKLRQPLLERTIRETGADLLCLQEMSKFSYEQLKASDPSLFDEYPFASEDPYPSGGARNRAVDTYLLSKYKPSRVTNYGLTGVLGYENALLVVEFPNLVVFNLYNQAGSRHSVGQEHKWIHYSRCRYDILETIYDMIKRRYANRNTIICGDFNFDLDGNKEEWPEVEMLDRYKARGFQDTYRLANPEDPGLTEDTDLNPMRWNQKLVEKHYRFDAIFYKPAAEGSWKVESSELVGTDYECLDAANSAWFIKWMSEAEPEDIERLTKCSGAPKSLSKSPPRTSKSTSRSRRMRVPRHILLPISPSDHFGVLTRFVKG